MTTQRFLTGITTSGTPHLGNYVGSIRPAVRASLTPGVQSFYFLADYHALIKIDQPDRIQRSTLEIAASWLAAGLDPERVVFYRQSDVPEIPELTWFLTCVLGKGVLNRAHAYKAAVDKNTANGTDPDADVSAGLFMYPVLMGADILMFNAHKVPVGRDQVQHIEMARDMAHSFNHRYGEHFVAPEAVIEDNVATLPGLDGRKMSKSYDNTIPMFASSAQLKKLIGSIVTDSKAPGEPKQTEGSALFQMYQAFASESETQALRQAYADGISWADAKQTVFERIDQELAPMRETYSTLMNNPAKIEVILLAGAAKARALATPFINQLRHAVGLRKLDAMSTVTSTVSKATKPSFKQYRETDGKFYFKLLNGQHQLLLQSHGFDSPKDAGQMIKHMSAASQDALVHLSTFLQLAPDIGIADVWQNLQLFNSD
ncbi:tryptophan--tRNA ligase [Rhodoferax sp.]|uniref:tryptophan--tRNA ligase n=1 Tax=Rhodoferax sp. TaxID=50421 RepID=UPI0026324395|nr:tryptophan--tRNA ligase [Rhodoferax sp.]MDD2808628.1 tryptophan--tRNA ligase [Rhodoferax sp.]